MIEYVITTLAALINANSFASFLSFILYLILKKKNNGNKVNVSENNDFIDSNDKTDDKTEE